jgi:hypothetical protein
MDAEAVRDSVLSVAGELDPTVGGQEIDLKLGLSVRRRSLYFEHHGEERMEFLSLFDAADACDCYRRTVSLVPQQSLALTNSSLLLNNARRLARRLADESPSADDGAFIETAFERVLCRPPTRAEREASRRFLVRQAVMLRSAPKLTPVKEVALVHPHAKASSPSQSTATKKPKGAKESAAPAEPTVPPADDPVQRARENLVHALFNHNDFVTIR